MLERDRELDVLDAALDAVRGGTGALVTISGPLGVGRTALLDAAAERARRAGLRVLRARATSFEQDHVLGVVRQLLPAEDPVPSPPELSDPFGPGPLLVLVDDLHRCDPASLTWLASLAVRLDRLGIVLVVTVIDGLEGPGGPDRDPVEPVERLVALSTRRLPLSALGVEGCAARLRDHGVGEPSREVVAALAETTGGLPSAVEAVLHEVTRDPGAPTAEAIREARPAALRARLVGELAGRSEAVRRTLAALVVVGDVTERELIAHVTGLDAQEVHRAVRTCVELGLVDARRPVASRPVLADVVGELMAGEERALRLRAASVLDDRGAPVDQVVGHLTGLSAPLPAWAVALLRVAARAAAARGEPAAAVGLLRHALLGCSGPDCPGGERVALLLELARLERGVEPGMAMRRVRRALPLLTSGEERAEALRLIPHRALEGAPPLVLRLVERTVEELAPEAERSAGGREAALALRARLDHVGKDDPARLRELAARSESVEELPLDTPAERELAAALLCARMLSGRGDAAQAARVGRRILEREPASAEHVHSPVSQVVPALCLADSLADLGPWLDLALAQAHAAGTVVEQAVILAEQAAVHTCSGRLAAADELAHRAWALLDVPLVDDPLLPAMVVAPLLVGLADPAPAARLADRHRHHEPVPVGLAALLSLMHARSAAEEGDLATAVEHCRESGRRADRAGWRRPPISWRPAAIDLMVRMGRTAEARELAERELADATAWGAPASHGRALRVVAGLVEPHDPEPLLREAVTVLRRSHNRLELARALRALGLHLVARGASEGSHHVLESERIVAALGLPPETVAPTAAPGRPLALVDPSSAPGRPDAAAERADDADPTSAPVIVLLTPSERRVATAAASGRTNGEIADELGVSLRAVEKRLTGIYRKLGIPGRAALADVLRAHRAVD